MIREIRTVSEAFIFKVSPSSNKPPKFPRLGTKMDLVKSAYEGQTQDACMTLPISSIRITPGFESCCCPIVTSDDGACGLTGSVRVNVWYSPHRL